MSMNSQPTNKDIHMLEPELAALVTNSHRDNKFWLYNLIPIMNTLLVVSAIGILTRMFLDYML